MINPSELIEGIQIFLAKKTEADEFSGSVLVAKDGRTMFEYVSGLANKEKNISNSIETKFNIGSANKMFTAIGIAHLVEIGKFSFQNKVGELLPDYSNKEVANKVRVHHLLTHTSGLGHFLNEKYMLEREKLKTIDDFIQLFINGPLLFEPGTKSYYSANGYTLLGKIIEVVSGQSYYEYIKENVYQKAQMPNTDSYEVDKDHLRDDIAIGYTQRLDIQGHMTNGERKDNLWINLVKGEAGGGGYSTARDLSNFSQSLLSYKLISRQMTETVLTPYINEGTKDGQTKYEGYGFQVWDIHGQKRFGHPGRFAGVNTRFDVYPDLGYVVIVLSNYDPPAAFDVAERISELITVW